MCVMHMWYHMHCWLVCTYIAAGSRVPHSNTHQLLDATYVEQELALPACRTVYCLQCQEWTDLTESGGPKYTYPCACSTDEENVDACCEDGYKACAGR
jgi:hypothetical protein